MTTQKSLASDFELARQLEHAVVLFILRNSTILLTLVLKQLVD